MTSKRTGAFGSWNSPITADAVVGEAVSLAEPRIDGDAVYWIEGRPREKGRNVVVRAMRGDIADVTPVGFDARSQVHSYGGGAYAVHDGTVYFVNFAQGDLMMLGGFFAFTFITQLGTSYWVGLILTVLAMAAFGALVERIVVRPILGYPQFSIVMVTIGLGFLLRSVAGMIWGTDDLQIETPFSAGVARFGALVLAEDKLSVIVATILLCLVLWLYFNKTRMGVAMQATSQNMLGAYYMGIPVKRVFSLIWAISAAVAGFAGVLLAPIAFIHTNVGFLGLKAFPAAVLGGFGSIPGALAGGIIIGVVETLSGFYLPEGFKDVAAYILLLVVLMVRPEGLFGLNLRKKV